MQAIQQNEPTLSDFSTRLAKRRKFYRKRTDDGNDIEDETIHAVSNVGTATTPLTIDELLSRHGHISDADERPSDGDTQLSVAEILRRRKATQRRRGGIEFTNAGADTKISSNVTRTIDTSADNEDTLSETKTVVNRFAPQTGQVADVNKHMMAYIDSELAKRRQGHDTSSFTSNGQSIEGLSLGGTLIDAGIHKQPAALGKLHEIDLGPDATLKNIARTEAAQRRLEGGEVEMEERTGKVRLRKDGKPWRVRRRRNSEDIKRDKLVEEVMKESRLEIYDEPEVELVNDDQAADDRIAEQFRREFLDAISSRRKRTSTATKAAKGAKVDDRPKGPKLGGSRSARAAMREQQEKAAKK